ncbi:MAG: ABC transporter substrate-binding protein [Pseudomonadota bacterium]
MSVFVARRLLVLGFLTCLFVLPPVVARALDQSAARAHVQATIADIVELITVERTPAENAAGLISVIERRGAPLAIARFAAGRAWRGMTEDQQTRFADALIGFVARSYARQFRTVEATQEEVASAIELGDAVDAGKKGVLVQTLIRPPQVPPISMNFLVSDRPGKIAVVDILIEGVSLAITQREVVGAMLEAKGGDVEALIADLNRGA